MDYACFNDIADVTKQQLVPLSPLNVKNQNKTKRNKNYEQGQKSKLFWKSLDRGGGGAGGGDVSSSCDEEVHSTSTSRSIRALTKIITRIETESKYKKCRAKIWIDYKQ